MQKTSAGRLPRSAYVLALIALVIAVGFGVLIPVLPVYAASFGVSHFQIGLVVSMFAILRFATSPWVQRLHNRFGIRWILCTGIWLVAGSSVLVGISQSYWQLLIFRGMGGIGSAMFSVSATTLLLKVVASNQRGQATGLFHSGFLLGGIAGPAIGGLLSNISVQAPFFFYAAVCGLAGLLGLLLLPNDQNANPQQDGNVASNGQLLHDHRFHAALLCNFSLGWNALGVRVSQVPLFVTGPLGGTPAMTGIAFAVGALVQLAVIPLASRVVDRVGRRPAVIVGAVACAVATSATPFSPNFPVLVGCFVVFAIGSGFLGTVAGALLGDATNEQNSASQNKTGNRASGVAIFNMVGDIGTILGPPVAGWLVDTLNYQAAFATGGVLFALTAIIGLRVPAGVPPPRAEPAEAEPI